MAKSGYATTTEGAVALSASTAKTILGVLANSNFGVDLKKFQVSFDGTTATATPVLVEVGLCTFGANAPGTNSTSTTVTQIYGRLGSTGFSAAKTWTTEPTTITVIKAFLLTPNGGTVMYDWPLGDSPDSPLGNGFVVRCTAPASVNVRGEIVFERC